MNLKLLEITSNLGKIYKSKQLFKNIENIYVFGSTSTGKRRTDSDIDILVIFHNLDIFDIKESALTKTNNRIVIDIKKKIYSLIGHNSDGKQYDLQISGSYELRFFSKPEIDKIYSNMFSIKHSIDALKKALK